MSLNTANNVHQKKHLGIIIFAVFFFSFFVSGAWADCAEYTGSVKWDGSGYYFSPQVQGCAFQDMGSTACGFNARMLGSGGKVCRVVNEGSCYQGWLSQGVVITVCQNQCQSDSVMCFHEGKEWTTIPGGTCDGKGCKEPVDSTVCDGARERCATLGGEFSSSIIDGECSSSCNTCGTEANKRILRTKSQSCCAQGLAPEVDQMCSTPVESGPGETYSTNANLTCSDPSLSEEAAQSYAENCAGGGGGSSSSDGGGSSSSGGSSGSDSAGVGRDYYPILDTIRDSLVDIRRNVESIYICMITPSACAGLSIQIPDSIKTPVFAFDTAFRKYLKPLMDSSLKLDSNQLKALMKLDTNILKQLRTDSVKLQNDTNTWRVVEGAGDQVDTSIHSMNDTTRKWFKRIADSIGVSTDSLVAHIDSIVRHIPDSVLDSIVKYQHYANDNFDSVLFGHGKGFSLVDSLIDSSVKYFKESNLKWNEYISMYGDSTQMIHEEIIDLPGRNASAIGSALGYGDTATSTLRGDLNGIREAIEGLGDTNGLGGHGGGYGDSLGRYRDSINKYYISDERFGELVDSTEAAWGVDSLDDAWDSSYAYGLCQGDDCPPCSDDSCMGSLPANFVQRADSIARIAGDSLEASTKRQRDSLPTFWDSTFKELKQYSWFGSFDSTFLANIGAKIPNSNTCPDHCFAMDVNGTYAYVGYNMHLDWKLCRPIAPDVLNSLNAFDILKLLARILTVVTCLSIIMWEVSSRRGGGIGL